MPVYKATDFFRKALESAVLQDYKDYYEIIVVDNSPLEDGVTEAQKIVQSFHKDYILYYRNEQNIGMFGNWNRCVELARSKYITYCHADDLLLPTCLSTLMSIQKKTNKRFIASAFSTIDENDHEIVHFNPNQKIKGILKRKKYFKYSKLDIFIAGVGFGVGCLFNKECMIALGGFNEEYYPVGDYPLFTKYLFKYGGIFNNIPTFKYRKATNESLTAYKFFTERDKFIRECMIPKIKLPSFFLRRIIKAKYNYDKVDFEIGWGHGSPELWQSVSKSDYRIIKLLKLLRLKRYTIIYKPDTSSLKNFCKDCPLTYPLYKVLKKALHISKKINERKRIKKLTHDKYKFIDRQKKQSMLVTILAGYKPYLYDDVFNRFERFIPKDMDVCIMSSGKYDSELEKIAEKNGWSYLSTKRNNVSLIQNIAITLHPRAEHIIKIDEDIFLTKNCIETMCDTFVKVRDSKEYFVGFVAPLLPVNGYCYRRLLDKLELSQYYKEKFEYPTYAACCGTGIEYNPEVAKFFWQKDNIFPNIDILNKKLQKTLLVIQHAL